MTVTRTHEDPRVTMPYSEAQWATIDALGEQVDRDLAAHDVRLTQGGEPTFVSIDDMEGKEWTIAALGTKKRELAEMLLRRLMARFAPRWIRAYRPGQVVSGRAAAALGAWRSTGAATGLRSGVTSAARRHAPAAACRSVGGARFHRGDWRSRSACRRKWY